MDLLAEIENLKSQYAAANELFETATAQANEAKSALAAKEQALAALEADKAAAAAQAAEALQAKQAELDAKLAAIAALEAAIAELKANAKSAEERAIELAAAQGIKAPKVEAGQAGAALTKEEALEQYANIADPVERGLFHAKHRSLLLG